MEQLSQVEESDNVSKIKELEQQLEKAKAYINHTEGAAKILENMIETGVCQQNQDGSVSVVH